jgi:hypothetical protein
MLTIPLMTVALLAYVYIQALVDSAMALVRLDGARPP